MKRMRLGLVTIFILVLGNSIGLAQGETCATAITIGSVPYSYSGTTCGSGNDYTIASTVADNPNLCLYPDSPLPGQNDYIEGEDFIFEFTASETNCYNFILDTEDNGAIHVFDSCPDNSLVTCLGFLTNNIGAPISVNVHMESGESVYIVISGMASWCEDFDLTVEGNPISNQPNDFCENAIDLQPTGSNTGATDCGEPEEWAPENYPGVDCAGGIWNSIENGVWFGITIDDTTPQPFSITINNVSCVGGTGTMQMGLWEDIGDCSLSENTFIECSVGIGTVSIGPLDLPLGDYHLFIDGNFGADCTWEFESELLCDLTITASSIDETCSGMMDGEINLVGNGGTPPLSYTIDGNPTTMPVTGLSSGTYTVAVIDDEGCEKDTVIIIDIGPSPTISATPIDESCNGIFLSPV